MKKNNKGFTLVELIVVLVILAILAAILVPALLGWIDKAREKSVTTNAEAALVATQGLVTEQYGVYGNPKNPDVATVSKIKQLTDIEESFTISWAPKSTFNSTASNKKNQYKLGSFTYHSTKAKKKAVWNSASGGWTVTEE